MNNRSPRRHRGYLLMEAALGGAVMIVIFGACLTLIADGRSKASYSARAQIAGEVATARLAELQQQPTLVATTVPLAVVDPVNYTGLRLGFDVVDVTVPFAASSPQAGSLFELIVRAEYSGPKGPEVITLRSLRRMP